MTDNDTPDDIDDLFSVAGGTGPIPQVPQPAENASEVADDALGGESLVSSDLGTNLDADLEDDLGELPENPYVIDPSLSSAPIVAQPEPTPTPYSAAPGQVPQPPAFGRRAPIHGPPADQHGYYPSDYYIGPDWMRIVVGGLTAAVILMAIAAGGLWLWDEFGDSATTDDEIAEATPTPIPLVPVYQCAGDGQPVTQILAPAEILIAGRTADGRWLAFRNPQAPPRQLWVRSSALPDFDTSTVGVVSCATSPDEFPTPVGRSTPVPTIQADPTPTPLN